MSAKPTPEPTAAERLPTDPCYDPVCGEEVARPDLAPSLTRDGQHLVFCSDRCKTRFLLDPQRYLVSDVEVA